MIRPAFSAYHMALHAKKAYIKIINFYVVAVSRRISTLIVKMANALYTNEQYADMHFLYGQAVGNAARARRLYQEQFPERRVPDSRTFVQVHRRLRETGTFQVIAKEGRPIAIQGEMEEQIMEMVQDNPRTSTRQISAVLNLSNSTVWRILRDRNVHPYHIQKVQELIPDDFLPRQNFSEWLLRQVRRDPHFLSKILFTDEASFSRDGIFNTHNFHVWQEANPHAISQKRHQHRFSLNIWCGIIGNHLIGPHVFQGILNAEMYLHFLNQDLQDMLDDIPLHVINGMWFMQDGAPAHFAIVVRQYLDRQFQDKWIGRGGPVPWPARSPDLNPLDFYLWGHLKSVVYETEVPTVEELQIRIDNACSMIRRDRTIFAKVRHSLLRRAEMCIETRGRHVEHLL